MWLGFCFLLFSMLFPESVILLARDREKFCEVILEWMGSSIARLWQKVVVGLPILRPHLKTLIFSCYNLKYGNLPCSYQGVPSEVYHFKANRILILWDCACKYHVDKASQTCSSSCSLQPFFQRAPCALMHHAAPPGLWNRWSQYIVCT